MTKLSIIIPVLNEAASLSTFLPMLQPLRDAGHEVMVVDGGSVDATVALAQPWVDQVVTCPPGRAKQMNAGAHLSTGDVLWFLHADTLPPTDAVAGITQVLEDFDWGCFNVRLTGQRRMLRVIAWAINVRSRLTAMVTGDQAIFIQREMFHRIGGFTDLPLMEDIDLAQRLKRLKKACGRVRAPVLTSSRKWEREGVLRTIVLMWKIRLLYFCGVSADRLAKQYYS